MKPILISAFAIRAAPNWVSAKVAAMIAAVLKGRRFDILISHVGREAVPRGDLLQASNSLGRHIQDDQAASFSGRWSV
jgi:hypothetical protein